MSSYLARLVQKSSSGVLCVLCMQVIHEPKTLPCDHVFCHKCLEDFSVIPDLLFSQQTPQTYKQGMLYCPVCLLPFIVTSCSNKIPSSVSRLVKSLRNEHCQKHGKLRVTATCHSCGLACCSTCCTAKEHSSHEISQHETVYTVLHTQLGELLQLLNERRLQMNQARRLRQEQQRKMEKTETDIKRHTTSEIEKLRQQEAKLLHQLYQRKEQLERGADTFLKLCRYNIQQTEQHIHYMHTLLENQPARKLELLSNERNLQHRCQALNMQQKPPPGYSLSEKHCFSQLQLQPVYKDSGLTFAQCKYLPSVSHKEVTMEELVSEHSHSNGNESPSEFPSACYQSFWAREKPSQLCTPYQPSSGNVEPGGVIFLPDDRMVVTERKAQKLSVYKKGYQEIDYDIKSLADIHPYRLTYWKEHDYLLFTDKRHFTIGMASIDGENVTSLKYEILRDPYGVDVLPSGHLVATDVHHDPMHRSAKIIDANKSAIVRRFHEFGKPSWVSVIKDGRMLISDETQKAIFVYDKSGNKAGKFSVNCPGQVIQDYNDDLLIASGEHGGKVMLYDVKTLTHKRDMLTPVHRIEWASGLALGAQGQLAVLQGTGILRLFDMYHCR